MLSRSTELIWVFYLNIILFQLSHNLLASEICADFKAAQHCFNSTLVIFETVPEGHFQRKKLQIHIDFDEQYKGHRTLREIR